MTELKDLMQIIAELSVAFAGFAGVVAAFSTFRIAPEATAYRVRIMVGVALLVLLASLLPFVLMSYGIAEVTAMRWSSLVFGLLIVAGSILGWRGLAPLYKARLLGTQAVAVVMTMLAGLATIGLITVAAGGLLTLGPAIYLSSLFFGICLCCFYFMMLMVAIEIANKTHLR